jgi:hypothetical protein
MEAKYLGMEVGLDSFCCDCRDMTRLHHVWSDATSLFICSECCESWGITEEDMERPTDNQEFRDCEFLGLFSWFLLKSGSLEEVRALGAKMKTVLERMPLAEKKLNLARRQYADRIKELQMNEGGRK